MNTVFPSVAAGPALALGVEQSGLPASADERYLRRLLAQRVAMPHTYFDDGEAFGQELGISIDFMREPVASIDAKLCSLSRARLAQAGAPAMQ